MEVGTEFYVAGQL